MVGPSQSGEFAERVERLLSSIDAAFDRLGDEHDIDVERTGTVLTITFESGRRMVVNSQEANREVWLAAKSGGFHYRWDDDRATWDDTRGDVDLKTRLATLVEEETGTPLVL